MSPVDEGAGIGRVVHSLDHATVIEFSPEHIPFTDAAADSPREGEVFALEVADHGGGGTHLPERIEHQTYRGLDRLIWIQHDRTGSVVHETDRGRHLQLPR